MLKSHLNAIESILLSQSQSASSAGHPNLRGGPREWFIRDFLDAHLPGTLEVGQGEVIDSASPPRPSQGRYRPQVDIVLYKRDLPKISLAKNHSAFLAEGVVATIEVKSKLTMVGVRRACEVSLENKSLNRNIPVIAMGGGWRPESIISYVVAFDGPKRIRTVVDWLPQIVSDLQTTSSFLPELIVILGRGLAWRLDSFSVLETHASAEGHTWAYLEQTDQNLFTLFVHMLSWMGWAMPPANLAGYYANLLLRNVWSC